MYNRGIVQEEDFVVKIYYSGSYNLGILRYISNNPFKMNLTHKLESYAYPSNMKVWLEVCELEKDSGIDKYLMIDSGAFTAWNSGTPVSLDRYIDYVKDFKKKYSHYFKEIYVVNLDVIPGKQGKKPTQEQVEESAAQGLANFRVMARRGIQSIHIYHQGEDLKWLDTMTKECEYIGISPCNDYSVEQKMKWLDDAFHYCPKDIRTHGFAVTSPTLLKRYPWTSVDSTSWRLHGSMGSINTPWFQIYISNRKEGMDENITAFRLLSKESQKDIALWMAKYGLSPQMCTTLDARVLVNYFRQKEIEEGINKEQVTDFKRTQEMLFEPHKSDGEIKPWIPLQEQVEEVEMGEFKEEQ